METKYRISKGDATLMIATALLFDFIQLSFIIFFLLGLIPVIGVIFGIMWWVLTSLFSVYAWLTFFVWFKIRSVRIFSKPSHFIKLAWTALIEMSPFGFLPAWTIFVANIIRETWVEDLKKKTPTKNTSYAQA